MQLELGLRLPVEMQMAARLASSFHCDRLRCSMQRALCIARQQYEPPQTVYGHRKWRAPRDPYCISGQCRQGLGVLLEERLVERARCPTCSGCGWVAR